MGAVSHAKSRKRNARRDYWVLLRTDGRIATKRNNGQPLIFATREEAQGWLSPSRSGPVRLAKLREVEVRADDNVQTSGAVGRVSVRYTVVDPTDRLGGGKHVRLEEALADGREPLVDVLFGQLLGAAQQREGARQALGEGLEHDA